MTDATEATDTEAKLERFRQLAENVGKELAFHNLALESLVFLSNFKERTLDEKDIEMFIHGYFFGAKHGRMKTPEDVLDYAAEE